MRVNDASKGDVGMLAVCRVSQQVIALGKEASFQLLRPAVIEMCQSHAVPVLCGGLTPSELLTAHELGADMVKLFPARLGGPAYLRDLLGPLPQLRVVPTGGVSAENARAYLNAGAAALGIGGNLVPARAVAQQDWAQITGAAQAIVAQVAATTPD